MSVRIFQSSSNQMEIDGLLFYRQLHPHADDLKKKMVNVPYIWDRDELEARVELKFCK